MSNYKNIQRLWQRLSYKRRRQFGLLLFLMLLSAIAEVLTLGSVLPFLSILVAPDKIFSHPFIANLSNVFGIQYPSQLALPLTIMFVSMAILAGLLRMLLSWVSMRVSFASGADLSAELYRRTLYQPYQVHIARNSSIVISGISKVEVVVTSMNQLVMLISSTIFLVAILVTLIIINPIVATSVIASFGLSYILIAWFSRRTLMRNSKFIAQERNQVIKSIQEGLGGIRDVIIDGAQNVYCGIYQRADVLLRKAQAKNAFISQSPRFAMEAIGMAMIASIAYILSLTEEGILEYIPLLGVLSVGAQRIMPSLQLVYSAWTFIVGNQASLEDAIDLLEQPMPDYIYSPHNISLPFKKTIVLNQISFSYSNESPTILDNIDLVIKKGSRIGFIGSTGSGKSTLLDIIMGLLQPTSGSLEVDGKRIDHVNQRAWQLCISHVPQTIYLTDSTIQENIAFGIPKNQIDFGRVVKAASLASISDEIMSMPEKYETFIGERGVRLSGGQRQRIGIARALYKQTDILILDEATSALDSVTEQQVMNSIAALDDQITVLIIAHKLPTLRNCSQIVELRDGFINKISSYHEIVLD